MRKNKQAWKSLAISTAGAGIWLGLYLINGGAWHLVGMGACLVLVVTSSMRLAQGRRP